MSAAVEIHAVKMKRGRLVTEVVESVDDELVPDIGFDYGKRPFSVYSNRRPLEHAIWICRYPFYIEVVNNCCRSCQCCQSQQWE